MTGHAGHAGTATGPERPAPDGGSAASVPPSPARPGPQGPSALAVCGAYAAVEAKILLRYKTPIVFIFLVPIALSLILGSAVTGLTTPGAGARSALGFAVMFSFMVVNYAGLSFLEEYDNNTWSRQALLRPPRLAFVAGKLVPPVVLCLVQLVGFWVWAAVALDLPVRPASLLLLPCAVALLATGAGLGALLYNLTSTQQAFQSLSFLVLVCGGGLGGAIVASSELPTGSRLLGYATPHYWTLETLTEVSFGTGSLASAWASIAVLLGLAAAAVGVATAGIDYCAAKMANR